MTSNDSLCNITFSKFLIKTGHYKRTCRYHKKQDQQFTGNDLFPKGFCPHLFRISYPYCLSLLYDGKYPQENKSDTKRTVQVKCPASDNSVELTIRVKFTFPYLIRKLKNLAIRVLQSLGISGEYPDRDIILEVSRVSNICPIGLTVGQSFRFNIWNRKELCPASFYALYPLLMRQIPVSQKSTQGENYLVHCPDPFGVYYECTTDCKTWDCKDFFTIKAEVVEARGQCPHGHREGDFFRLEDILPKGFCPLAFYSLFPYYQTLIHSGRFEWVKKGEQVKVQCPKVDGVVMEIELIRQSSPGEGVVRVTVVQNRGICPKGLNQGDTFEFDSQNQPFCFHAMVALIPFKIHPTVSKHYTCCGITNHLLFKLE